MTITSHGCRTLQFTKTQQKPLLPFTATFRRNQGSGHSFQFTDKERRLRGKKKGEAQGCEMMPHGSQNRQWQNILRSRTRETGGRQEQKGGSE